jgi:hypothetical protein
MREHLFALIPLGVGAVLLIVGRIFDDLPLTAFSLFLVLWGVVIHGNHMASTHKRRSLQR